MITLYEKSEDFILNLKNELQPVINEVRDWKQFFFSTKKTYILSRLSVFLSLVLWYNIVEVFFKGESFMKDMQKARDKGAYSDADYNAMSEAYEYGLSVI